MLGIKYFSQNGYEVHLAKSIKQAKELAQKLHDNNHTIDVVLSDFRLPDGIGLDLFPLYQSLFPNVILLACSGYCGDNREELSKEKGAQALFEKPFQFKVLDNHIKQLLAESQ